VSDEPSARESIEGGHSFAERQGGLGHQEGERLEHRDDDNDDGHGEADGENAEADLALLLDAGDFPRP
jgi:hypothetical protein